MLLKNVLIPIFFFLIQASRQFDFMHLHCVPLQVHLQCIFIVCINTNASYLLSHAAKSMTSLALKTGLVHVKQYGFWPSSEESFCFSISQGGLAC